MHKNLSGVAFPLLGSLTVSGILIFSHNQVLAQVTPDNTLGNESSVVNTRDANTDSIDGGAIRGQNLFHSFQEFNVDADRGVYFANPDAVTNIFSRVTGNNVSNILGTLGVDGAANLFLINPNGIIFGEGASLDVQGSFAATTADGIEFGEQGFFSASNPESPKLLTINPSAYLFNQIENQQISGIESQAALSVSQGKNLVLLGGNILLDGSEINVPGGRVDLGGLATTGKIEIDNTLGLKFPQNVARENIFLVNGTAINTSGEKGGEVQIQGRNVLLKNNSNILSFTRGSQSGGDLIIDASESLEVIGDGFPSETLIFTITENTGSAGNIEITTKNLTVSNGASISTQSLAEGQGGNITINASESFQLLGDEAGREDVSGVLSGGGLTALTRGSGKAGNIAITTGRLVLQDEMTIGSDSYNSGLGGNVDIQAENISILTNSSISASSLGLADAGKININAQQIEIDGISEDGEFNSSITSQTGGFRISDTVDQMIPDVNPETASGNAGDITIDTEGLIVSNGASIRTSSFNAGSGGNINLKATESVKLLGNEAGTLSLQGGGLAANAEGSGKAGNIAITTGRLILQDKTFIESNSLDTGVGGNLNIQADNISLQTGSSISASTSGLADAGNITISAKEINVNGLSQDEEQFRSRITTRTGNSSIDLTEAIGDAGDIFIDTERLTITNGANITATTSNAGSGGNINIQASESVELFGQGVPSLTGFYNFAFDTGDAGNVEIATTNFILQNGAGISTKSFDEGQGGNITINATESMQLLGGEFGKTSFPGFFTGGGLAADAVGSGKAGNIEITTEKLNLQDQTSISSDSTNTGVGGNLNIKADTISIKSGSTISGSTAGLADAGNITITAKKINIDGTSQDGELDSNISTQTGGFINFDVDPSTAFGNAGDLTIDTEHLIVSNQASIRTSTRNAGSAGNLNVRASDSVELNGGKLSADTQTGSSGNAGELSIETQRLSVRDGGQIGAGSFGEGQGGKLEIYASDSIELIGKSTEGISSGLFTSTENSNSSQGGEIDITTTNLYLSDNGSIYATAEGTGKSGDVNINILENLEANNGEISTSSTQSAGGAINITADNINLRGDSDIRSDIFSGAGGGGNINITADSIIAFDDSDIFAFAADGQGGNITLDTPAYFAENFTLNSLTSNPDSLVNNSRADLNATGAVSGVVSIPDVSFIQNGLTNLPDNSINTDELVANSCVSPVGKRQEGKFIITGTGGLPVRPGNDEISDFATGEVRSVPSNNSSGWRRGDPIVEPQGVYRLTNGKLVMSRECHSQ